MSRDHDAQNKNVQGLQKSLNSGCLDYRGDYKNKDLNTDTFTRIHFIGAVFDGADLTDATFENCTFEMCSFQGACLTRAHFESCMFDIQDLPSGIVYDDGPTYTGCVWGK